MENTQNKYAGFWIRLAASIVDFLVLAPLILVILYLFMPYFSSGGSVANPEDSGLFKLISYVISICYTVFFIASRKQATPGKRLCGIYVATKDGQKLTKLRSLGRLFASLLSSLILGIGFFMIAFTKEKTALHDLICDTRVFRGKVN